MAYNLKDVVLAVIYSYAAVTILNYLFHYLFPSVPIVKTGIAILIFGIGIIISTLFVFTRDGSFGKDDIQGLLVVTALVIGLYFLIRWTLPDLFSILPSGIKETFSIFSP